MVEEPWASRLLAADRAGLLVDFRQPAEVERVARRALLRGGERGGRPAHRGRSQGREAEAAKARARRSSRRAEAPSCVAYARAVAAGPGLARRHAARDRWRSACRRRSSGTARFVARLAAAQAAYAGTGEPTREGLAATLRVLRGRRQSWPVTLTVGPSDSRRPPRSPRPGASSARHRRRPERRAPPQIEARREPERSEETGRRPKRQAHDVRVAALDPADRGAAPSPWTA